MSDNYLKDLFIDEVKGSLNKGGGGGITELPEHLQFGSEFSPFSIKVNSHDNVIGDGWENWCRYFLYGVEPLLHINDILTVEIRGDRYMNLKSAESHSYYKYMVWGSNYGDNGPIDSLPFSFSTNISCWDGDDGYIIEDNGPVCFEYDAAKYPDLDFDTEVKIYKQTDKPIDTKYLPEHLQFGAIVDEITINSHADSATLIEGASAFNVGDTVTIIVDGVEYSLVAYDDDGYVTIGDPYEAVNAGTGELGWQAYINDNDGNVYFCSKDAHAITYVITSFKTIDSKYIPKLGTVGSLYEGSDGGEIFNDYENNKASGMFSHAEGYYTTASGDYSHAEGFQTTASGLYSHAEGYSRKASGDYSHAEGFLAEASGSSSHAEGSSTTASGTGSHAEGSYTDATGKYSHAEGFQTHATGDYSHTEGNSTIASGKYSHAEGYGTGAYGSYSHVQGKYNIEDANNKYAHIVGNGTSNAERSNAHTLDWEGNAWFAGGIELTSPNGTRYRFTVSDDGTLSATVVTES